MNTALGLENELRIEARRQRHRMAARRSRVKKQQQYSDLLATVVQLRIRIAELEAENAELIDLIDAHNSDVSMRSLSTPSASSRVNGTHTFKKKKT